MTKQIKRIFTKQNLIKLIDTKHKQLYTEKDFYKPISISIQGNNYCSLGTCKECGIAATNNKQKSKQLPKKIILNLLKQAEEEGIFLYYTNFTGEITDDLDFFKIILKNNRNMDAYKININCSKFKTLKEAEKIFKKLKKIGWTKTKYVIPTCALSIGIQEHKVPLVNVAHGIEAFNNVFTTKEAKLFISHYYTNSLYHNTFKRLQRIYAKTYNKRLSKSLLKSDPITCFGRARKLPISEFKLKSVYEYTSKLNCFNYWHKKYISPEIYIHRDGRIYTCPLFEPHKFISIGNVKKNNIKTAIKNANENSFLRLISEKGTEGIYNLIKNKYPEIKKIKVTNRHEACEILGEYYQKINKIKKT